MRLFIASSFPPEVLRDLNDRVSRLRPRLPAAAWVRPESQHLTYAFLGEQTESVVNALDGPLGDALARVARFDASLHGCGFFPNQRRARVGWAGLDPESGFSGVAQVVREVVQKNGIHLDGGDFRPHLTLLRVRDRWPPASIELFCRSLADYRSASFDVGEVTLYWSKLDPKGAVHTPLRTYALAV
jgi:2'-5' RNA ligase